MSKAIMLKAGGGISLPPGVEIGTFTVEEIVPTVTVSHRLGASPKFAAVFCCDNSSLADSASNNILFEILPQPSTEIKNSYIYSKQDAATFYVSVPYTTYPAEITDTSVTFVTGRYYGAMFKPGYTYLYIIVR